LAFAKLFPQDSSERKMVIVMICKITFLNGSEILMAQMKDGQHHMVFISLVDKDIKQLELSSASGRNTN
jgi:hypothetical protein